MEAYYSLRDIYEKLSRLSKKDLKLMSSLIEAAEKIEHRQHAKKAKGRRYGAAQKSQPKYVETA